MNFNHNNFLIHVMILLLTITICTAVAIDTVVVLPIIKWLFSRESQSLAVINSN